MAIEFYFECVTCQETLRPSEPGLPCKCKEEAAWIQKHSKPGHDMQIVIPTVAAKS